MNGITFDTGALIGLEQRHQRIARVYASAVMTGRIVTVPVAVIAEWWRGGNAKSNDAILRGVRVEDMTTPLAKLAGEALAATPGATTVDAIVMASAAIRGDLVYTSDVGDLQQLQGYFPSVRVLAV